MLKNVENKDNTTFTPEDIDAALKSIIDSKYGPRSFTIATGPLGILNFVEHCGNGLYRIGDMYTGKKGLEEFDKAMKLKVKEYENTNS